MLEKKIKVVIADDHPLIRSGVRKIFEQTSNIIVVGEAANGQEAIALVESLCPDVLLLDIQMPVMDGIQALDFLHESQSDVIVLIVSAFDDTELVKELHAKGAWGCYQKESAPTQLVAAVNQAVLR